MNTDNCQLLIYPPFPLKNLGHPIIPNNWAEFRYFSVLMSKLSMQLSKKPGIRPTHRNGKMNANIALIYCIAVSYHFSDGEITINLLWIWTQRPFIQGTQLMASNMNQWLLTDTTNTCTAKRPLCMFLNVGLLCVVLLQFWGLFRWEGHRSQLWGPIWVHWSQVSWNKISCQPFWCICWHTVLL